MSIRFGPGQLEQIRRHGESTYPEECGGLLLGTHQDGVTEVVEVLSLENVRGDSRHNRVELAPLDTLRAEKRAAALGLGVWGYYHSHPDHPAVPSQFDLEHAPLLDWSYVIVSIRQGQSAELRSWRLTPGRERFEEETISEEAN